MKKSYYQIKAKFDLAQGIVEKAGKSKRAAAAGADKSAYTPELDAAWKENVKA